MPAGTPHPGLLNQVHACFVISPQGVFATDEPDALPREIEKNPSLLRDASVLSRSLSDQQIDQVIAGGIRYIYCESLSIAQQNKLREAGVELLH